MQYRDAEQERADIRAADADLTPVKMRFYAPSGLPQCVDRYVQACVAAQCDFEAAHRVNPDAYLNLIIYGRSYGWTPQRARTYARLVYQSIMESQS